MIRINLLPHREMRRKMQRQAFVALLTLAACIGVVVLMGGAGIFSALVLAADKCLVAAVSHGGFRGIHDDHQAVSPLSPNAVLYHAGSLLLAIGRGDPAHYRDLADRHFYDPSGH